MNTYTKTPTRGQTCETLRQDLNKKAENVKNVVEALNGWHEQLHNDYQQKLRQKATIASHITSLNDKIAALTPVAIESTDPETAEVTAKIEMVYYKTARK